MSTSSSPTHTNTSSVDVPSTPPEDSPKSRGFKLRIATFRDAVDTLNWNRNDLSWLTTITLAGRRQLSWPVQTDAGRAREAGLP